MSTSSALKNLLNISDSVQLKLTTPPFYDLNETLAQQQQSGECLYEETQLERSQFEEEGYYDLEIFTHYLSGFGGLSLAIVGLALNSFCAFTMCRAAVFRSHLVFLCGVAIADALQLSCLIIILTRDTRQPDPRYLNLLPRVYIRAFLYLYPLSKFFHLTMAWLVMASAIDCWRWISKAQRKEEWLRTRLLKSRSRSFNKSNSSNSELVQPEAEFVEKETKAKCRVIISEILAITAIALLALVYTIPAAWENKGDILILGKQGMDNCTPFIYHLLPTDLARTDLYRIGYGLFGHLVFQTGIPLVTSSIAIAKISRQLQLTSSSLGQLVTDAVQLVIRTGERFLDRQQIRSPTYSQRVIVENRNIIHCSLFLSVFTFYVCHVPQLWAKIQWSLMHVDSHQNSHMKYVNEFVNFMTVANATINGFFLLCFCRRYIADGARDIDMCAWCFPPKDGSVGGGICSRGDVPSGSSDREEEDEEQDDYQDVNVDENEHDGQQDENEAKQAVQIDDMQPPDIETVGHTRHNNSPVLGGRVATVCDGQYLLHPNDMYPQAQDPHEHQHRHHRHHHRRHRHSRHNIMVPPQEFYDADIGNSMQLFASAPPLPRFQHQHQQQQPFPPHQQYFTMGPQDGDIYIAAQV